MDPLDEAEIGYRDFRDQAFKDGTLAGKDLSFCTFTHCVLDGCSLAGSRFERTRFEDCAIVNIDNSGARFIDVEFERCKIVGLSLYRCDQSAFDLSFKGCKLLLCNFSDANMKCACFRDCGLEECYFQNTFLRGADFSGAAFRQTLFNKCDLKKASFRDARGYSIDPRENDIAKCVFSAPDVLGLLDCFDITIG